MKRSPGLAAFLLLGACGPMTAKYVLDDTALAPVPISEKQSIFSAQNDVSTAKAEQQQTQAALDGVNHELDLAKLEREQTSVAQKGAKLEMEMANQLKDSNRISQAGDKQRLSDLSYNVADAKVDMLDRKRKWAKENVGVSDRKLRAALARVEAEKARLAAAKGIMPTKDFAPNIYLDEFASRQKDLDGAMKDADEAKAKWDEKSATYNQLAMQYQQAGGAQQQQPQYAPVPQQSAPSMQPQSAPPQSPPPLNH